MGYLLDIQKTSLRDETRTKLSESTCERRLGHLSFGHPFLMSIRRFKLDWNCPALPIYIPSNCMLVGHHTEENSHLATVREDVSRK